jgi:serine/threonine protein kinase
MEVTRDQWRRIKSVAAAAWDQPTEARATFLDSACAGDPSLRREVEQLLESTDAAATMYEAPALSGLGVAAAFDAIARAQPAIVGVRIGPYRIERELGRGGMGGVYLGERVDGEFDHRVAIKFVGNVASAAIIERFREERRILATLDHPNIARLLDGGTSSSGIPYVVMDYVDGVPIDEYCIRHNLSVRAKLELFRQVCAAVDYAHQQLVVHRDIKASNILVTPAGVPKLLDFGIAKIVEPREPAAVTAVRALTPESASPEQIRSEPITIAADVYALGVLLYRLLTGRSPYGSTLSDHDLMQAICERTPDPPGIDRDLDLIVLKALRKEPERRYGSVEQLSADVARYLNAEPVLAAPDSASYRMRKFVARHRTSVAIAAIIGVTAAVAAAVATYLALPREGRSISRSEWVQLTNLDSVTQPALSPDGRMLAFIRGSSTFTTNGQVYVKSLSNGETVPLTRDSLPKMGAVFSPGGDHIAYTVTDGGSWDTWMVPVSGGEPRRWLRNASGLTWVSPDRLLFSEIKSAQHMAIITSDESRGDSRDVYVPKEVLWMAHRSYLSPDGRWVLVVEMDEKGTWLPCRLVPLDGSFGGTAVGPPTSRCTGAAWSPDGTWVYLSTNAGDGFHIWRQRFPHGEPEQLTSGPTEEEGLAIAPDGKSLITSVGLLQRSVWVHDASGERQISLEGYAYWPLLSASGRKLCFRVAPTVTTGQAPSQLWVADLSSGRTERLFGAQLVNGYDVSSFHDQVVASIIEADGKSRLWLAWLDGREPAKRIPGAEGDNPRFGRNRDIFFRADDGVAMSLFRIQLDGTARERITRPEGTVFGTVSPDGKWISNYGIKGAMVAISTTDGTSVPILAGNSRMRWSPDGTRVYVSVPYGDSSAFGVGRTYVIPLQAGSVLPPVPPGGFRSEADLAAVPGVETLPYGVLALGPSHGVYAFSRTTTARNLYRILLP